MSESVCVGVCVCVVFGLFVRVGVHSTTVNSPLACSSCFTVLLAVKWGYCLLWLSDDSFE